jgi:tRNA G46 methylase TrmB
LANYIEQEPERRRVEQEKLKKKIEAGLKESGVQKIRFDDKEYEENHGKVLEILDQAIGAGLQKEKTLKLSKKPSKKVSVWLSDDSSEED